MSDDYENKPKKGKERNDNYNIKYPFVKMKEGFSNKNVFLYGKLKRSDKVIHNQVDQLLLSGFEGTEEDFKSIYYRNEPVKKVKLKTKFKLNRNLMINHDFLSNSIKFSKIKGFVRSDKNKNHSHFKRILQNSLKNYRYKKEREKEDELKYEEKYKEIFKDKSTLYLGTKSNSSIIDTYKNSTNKTHGFPGKNSSLDNKKYKEEKMRRIKKIRNILNQKSNSILGLESQSIQNENRKSTKIPLIKLENGTISNDNNNNKLMYKTVFFKDNKSKSKSSKSENDEKIIHDINKVFKKFLKKKKEDQTKLKKVLDPLQKGFKSNLKEVQKFVGNNRENIWMKKSTANLISFGNAFQLMDDDIFYRHHKRIIGKYPELEKEAQLLVPLNKARDNSIIEKLEKNERKIRFICNDSEALLRGINQRCLEHKMMRSKSEALIKFKNGIN